MAVDYKKLAQAEVDSNYNTQVTNLKNTLAQNLLALDQNKTGINTNYDAKIGNQNLANVKGKNSFSNTMLGRGLSQSSIVGTGLGEQDQINKRVVGEIDTERFGKLGAIDSQKSLLEMNNNNDINTLTSNRDLEIMKLARELEDRDWDKSYKLKQLSARSGGNGSNVTKNSSNSNSTNATTSEQIQAMSNVAKRLLAEGDTEGADEMRRQAQALESRLPRDLRFDQLTPNTNTQTPVAKVAKASSNNGVSSYLKNEYNKTALSSILNKIKSIF